MTKAKPKTAKSKKTKAATVPKKTAAKFKKTKRTKPKQAEKKEFITKGRESHQIDPLLARVLQRRAAALERAHPLRESAAIVHALVYVGDQIGRLVERS